MNKLKFIEPKKAPSNVAIKTSTKFGGYSSEPYGENNMGYFTGEEKTIVLKNFLKFEKLINSSNIVTLNQVHGIDVLEVDHNNKTDILFEKADGLFTREKNLPLGVITADCLPIFLVGKESISSLHCGWRSLNGGIIDKSFALFKKYNDFPEYAFIGPGICEKCYEVGIDLVDALNPNYKPNTALKQVSEFNYMLNLKKLAVNALEYNGLKIDNIEVTNYTSCCHEEFYSYRLENGTTGRMVSVIEMK